MKPLKPNIPLACKNVKTRLINFRMPETDYLFMKMHLQEKKIKISKFIRDTICASIYSDYEIKYEKRFKEISLKEVVQWLKQNIRDEKTVMGIELHEDSEKL